MKTLFYNIMEAVIVENYGIDVSLVNNSGSANTTRDPYHLGNGVRRVVYDLSRRH